MIPQGYHLLDVFTETAFKGNPVAVFPRAEALSDAEMQLIARELNLSECVFVLPPRQTGSDLRFRIFTPTMELPFAGHPTIGAALAVTHIGRSAPGDQRLLRIEEEAGLVIVEVGVRAGAPFAELTTPQLPEPVPCELPPTTALLEMLNLEDGSIGPAASRAYSAGVPYTLVPVVDQRALGGAELDLGRWRKLLGAAEAPHLYLFTIDDWANGRLVTARMFAPAMGIQEDPATGAAASALAGMLVDLQRPGDGSHEWTIHQGVHIGRPSVIAVRAEVRDSAPVRVRIGGTAALVGNGTIEPGTLPARQR